jgi:hypothetical protein
MNLCWVAARRLRSAAVVCWTVWALTVPGLFSALALNVTLGWDLSPDPTAAGYNVYYGAAPRAYTNLVSVGNTNYATISNLVSGTTYYFAATTYNVAGLESDFSTEVSYTPLAVPANVPPTLDPIPGVVVNEGAGLQTVELTGISSGSISEKQTLTVSAFSSDSTLIPNPAVSYVSPSSTGTVTFAPVAGAFGSATLTVMVDDGGTVSNTVIRSVAVTVLPVNDPPTLDPIDNVAISENAGRQTVPLSGISAGNTNENQTITITAKSSNVGLIPDPVVNYTSPNTAGALTLSPITNAFGTAVVSVVANDGQFTNASITRTFTVTVNQVVPIGNVVTNVTIVPNQSFRFALYPPIVNGDRFSFSLDASAPAGASITMRRGVPTFTWTPTSAQASTTNSVTIRADDLTTPKFSTNLAALVIVLDYLGIIPVGSAVEAGQAGSLPLCVSSSEGVTNVVFDILWPTSLFAAPTLRIPPSSKISGTAQLQGSTLRISLNSQAGRVITGSNVVASVNFQAVNTQPSAFVELAINNVAGTKPTGAVYAYSTSHKTRMAVVSDRPLLEWAGGGAPVRTYGRVGTNYVLQACTNLLSTGLWWNAISYTQTNVVQVFGADSSRPLLLYRMKQQ